MLEQLFNLFPNLKQLKIQVKMFTPLTCFSHCADLLYRVPNNLKFNSNTIFFIISKQKSNINSFV